MMSAIIKAEQVKIEAERDSEGDLLENQAMRASERIMMDCKKCEIPMKLGKRSYNSKTGERVIYDCFRCTRCQTSRSLESKRQVHKRKIARSEKESQVDFPGTLEEPPAVKIVFDGQRAINPINVNCHVCNFWMRLCMRRTWDKGWIEEYPAYRCLKAGCGTFRSVEKIMPSDTLPIPNFSTASFRDEMLLEQKIDCGFYDLFPIEGSGVPTVPEAVNPYNQKPNVQNTEVPTFPYANTDKFVVKQEPADRHVPNVYALEAEQKPKI